MDFQNICIFDDISSGEPLVDNLNLKIEFGQKVLLIADSNTPISSILDLILQFNLEYTGKIDFQGKKLKNLSLVSLRNQITYIE